MDATRSLEDARRTVLLNEKVRRHLCVEPSIHSHHLFLRSPQPSPNPFPPQVTALLLTGQRPDAPPCLGPGASESSSEATYLSLLCDQEAEKKRRKGRKGSSDGRAPTTTHTVPPSHIAGLLRQEMARQQELVRLHSSFSRYLLPLVLSVY